MKKNLNIGIFLLSILLIISCLKEDDIKVNTNGSGTFTSKFSLYDATTKKWSAAETFTAVKVATTKTGNDFTSVATDASGNVFTLYAGFSAVGKYPSRGIFVRMGKTYSSSSGQIEVTAYASNKFSATFITENNDWSMYDGKLEATF